MSAYEQILHDLGQIVGYSLRPDNNQSCKMEIGSIVCQIDLDASGEDLLVGSNLGEVPPGPWRDKLFKQALKANGFTTTSQGVLAFTTKDNSLILFQFIPLAHIDAQKLHQFLIKFVEHAKIWKEALQQGQIPTIEDVPVR